MDVTEANFESAVIERSRELPVVVDFWAEWCGPCRALGPVLEKAVAQRDGKIELVKLDTDANPALAQIFRIQSIPAVMAFKDGTVVSQFIGAQPPDMVDRFLDSLLPSEAQLLAAQGDEASLRRALELEPTRADAAVPLAKLLLARDDYDGAREVLDPVTGSFAADGLLARIELEQSSEPAPVDLAAAFDALDHGRESDALDRLLDALPTADGAKDQVRRVIVGVLEELGPEDELARSARRRLASALY